MTITLVCFSTAAAYATSLVNDLKITAMRSFQPKLRLSIERNSKKAEVLKERDHNS